MKTCSTYNSTLTLITYVHRMETPGFLDVLPTR
jgi:hypothetical protein